MKFICDMQRPRPIGAIVGASFDDKFTLDEACQHLDAQTAQNLRDIIADKRPMTPEMAYVLSLLFYGDDPDCWIMLQAYYDAWRATTDTALRERVISSHIKSQPISPANDASQIA